MLPSPSEGDRWPVRQRIVGRMGCNPFRPEGYGRGRGAVLTNTALVPPELDALGLLVDPGSEEYLCCAVLTRPAPIFCCLALEADHAALGRGFCQFPPSPLPRPPSLPLQPPACRSLFSIHNIDRLLFACRNRVFYGVAKLEIRGMVEDGFVDVGERAAPRASVPGVVPLPYRSVRGALHGHNGGVSVSKPAPVCRGPERCEGEHVLRKGKGWSGVGSGGSTADPASV